MIYEYTGITNMYLLFPYVIIKVLYLDYKNRIAYIKYLECRTLI
jgi:hypothetical protein